ncbi:MAG: acyl-CoA dehydrogenase [Deltaproteobacteria bacterium]|nr:acyl-CoA dehydrogenase [Deltaproteobacteria bacterium]
MPTITPTEWPFFEPRHRLFAKDFRSWVAAHLGHFESDEGGDGQAAREIFRLLAADGWLGPTVAPDPGGPDQRMDLRRVCLMREILAYSSAMADVAFSEPWLAALPIALYGSQEQKRKHIEPYSRAEFLPAFALSEPEAGSDAAAIAATATPSGAGFVLNGRKTWISNSGLADLYVVFVRLAGEEGAQGLSAFLVAGANSGVTLEKRLRVLPPHTLGTLRFDDCFVEATALLGRPVQGFEIAMRALELFRPTVGAACLGFARRAMDEALQRSCERTTFRKPIAQHQLIQEKLADMAVKTDAAALLVYRAAWAHDRGSPSIGREASIAKLYASEIAQEVVDQALQIFGGLGVVEGTTVERLYRHVRAFRIFDGTSEIQKLVIAKHLLKG